MSKTANARIAFFGTPRFAVQVLEEMEKAGILPNLVITMPDRPAGRGLVPKASPVKVWAEGKDIPVAESFDTLAKRDWDLFIVAAYGKVLPFSLLKLPHAGTLNVHPSLLPKYRGPSPVESQILADEKDIGVSIMLVDEELDHGPIVKQEAIQLEAWPLPASALEERLARAGVALLAEIIPTWIQEAAYDEEGADDRTLIPEPQAHSQATFTKKIEKEDGHIDLSADPRQNYLKFCAYDGWPGTYFFKGSKRIKIADAKFSNGEFRISRVIPEGKREMAYEDFLRS